MCWWNNIISVSINEFFLTRYQGVNPVETYCFFKMGMLRTTLMILMLTEFLTGKTLLPIYQGGFGFNSSYKVSFFQYKLLLHFAKIV
jgi:hypothetical protein